MNLEDELKKQLLEDNQPDKAKETELYRIVFNFLNKEKESLLSNSFEEQVISRLPSSIFSWREVFLFLFFFLIPLLFVIYWTNFPNLVVQLPVVAWIIDHSLAIIFGVLLLVGIQITDRYLIRHLNS